MIILIYICILMIIKLGLFLLKNSLLLFFLFTFRLFDSFINVDVDGTAFDFACFNFGIITREQNQSLNMFYFSRQGS